VPLVAGAKDQRHATAAHGAGERGDRRFFSIELCGR